MIDLVQILEEELEEAVEVKNKKSLHRYITLLTENLARKEENRMEHSEFQQELIRIDGRFNSMITEVREGFRRMDDRFETMQKQMDQRFEAVNHKFEAVQKQMDQRFESVDLKFEAVNHKFYAIQKQMDERFNATDKRFNRQTTLMTIGFIVITTLITIYQFLG